MERSFVVHVSGLALNVCDSLSPNPTLAYIAHPHNMETGYYEGTNCLQPNSSVKIPSSSSSDTCVQPLTTTPLWPTLRISGGGAAGEHLSEIPHQRLRPIYALVNHDLRDCRRA